jgi:hypothetical protein
VWAAFFNRRHKLVKCWDVGVDQPVTLEAHDEGLAEIVPDMDLRWSLGVFHKDVRAILGWLWPSLGSSACLSPGGFFPIEPLKDLIRRDNPPPTIASAPPGPANRLLQRPIMESKPHAGVLKLVGQSQHHHV